MAKAVKLSDIAGQLGVSTVTVSKALSNQKGVSEEMRTKIQNLASELGYRKYLNPQSRGTKGFNVGVLVSEVYVEKYSTFYWEMYQAINTCAARENCFVLLEVLSTADEKELTPPKLLTEDKVDGMLILGAVQGVYLEQMKKAFPVPLVFLDFYDASVKEEAVISNSYYGTYELTNYLIEKGHRDIAYVGTLLTTGSITDRYFGYARSLLEHGIPLREEWVLPDRDQKRRMYDDMPMPKKMPTAFVCNCDLTAGKVINTLQKQGLKVPEDVSVVGFDDYIFPGLCDVAITTYSVNMNDMAETGLHTLRAKLSGEKYNHGMNMVGGHLIEKGSVRQIKTDED